MIGRELYQVWRGSCLAVSWDRLPAAEQHAWDLLARWIEARVASARTLDPVDEEISR